MPVIVAAVADVIVILLFASIGRDTHEHGVSVAGVLATAWPFLTAAAAGWLLSRAWRSPLTIWPTGVVVWVVAVAGGLVLRGLTGGGLAFAFQLVTAGFLGVVLLGHRLIGTLVSKRISRQRPGRS
ncbi:DUF3054 domain-containing protein [Arthrobacter castelli]|uniref:DUF3054 domain-containing protein n=1 Tax=Arthrobacter castelli TaxID=271431 RepID=UPI00056735E8|nr:DUF3054 domain-containing protein [Arthrobacter castelli]